MHTKSESNSHYLELNTRMRLCVARMELGIYVFTMMVICHNGIPAEEVPHEGGFL